MLGIEKQTEGLRVFIISLLLTPLAGLIYVYSKKPKSSNISYFHCHDCDYIYPVKMRNCPICLEKGVKVKLKKYQSPYKISEEIGTLRLA